MLQFKSAKLVAAIFFALFLIASQFKSLGFFDPFFAYIEQSLGGDLVLHFVATGVVTLFVYSAFAHRRFKLGNYAFNPALAVLVVVFTGDELLQLFSDLRDFSWLDLAGNYAGVISGIALSHRL
ncbi:hypothetical protein [Vibrio sp. WXL103]|uniref:hypothetical protein n=1 Tax=Vibrio sp. WXL103 TaxID=3450710 RepID=UPI003EC70D8B